MATITTTTERQPTSLRSTILLFGLLAFILVLLSVPPSLHVHAFNVPTTTTRSTKVLGGSFQNQLLQHQHQTSSFLLKIRGGAETSINTDSSTPTSTSLNAGKKKTTKINGGDDTVASKLTTMISAAVTTLTSATVAGPWGVASLWAVAASVVVPCTLKRQGYAFSVGYGFSILGQAVYLSQIFKHATLDTVPGWFLLSTAVYGGRLGIYLLQREFSVPSKASQIKSFDKSPPLKRIPFAASVASLYAFLMTPCLYALRGTAEKAMSSTSQKVLLGGAVLSWAGVVMEAVADYHKFYVKQKKAAASKEKEDDEKPEFVGPTGGVYSLTRHPNYTGEVLFWFGQLIGGSPFLGKSIIGWGCSLVGFYGIYSIMTMATKRLDKRQQESYGGQAKYDEWRKSSKAPIFPFMNVE
mmetsp:Transcript_49007/g.118707  ORF Transcript_49007/g.118707 Transcript_49007/m.118707 type:complete len:411 (-) Transcript_49007:71-1303(-)|eukprot:CAMPEP_0113463082 /NCGR_PEP_ID=MMETSP0014_2-20120614/12452_1 /TAXON_ID=2857 /ORGANISM="Nitzschia sp." /LENGTH=410 /DNA_ID=CAMNT_0000355021 /DNA_START=194 /DNA_END=1426 /DNA_ORIENTATION=- /assembly_acc=CAM_ASM_000159